MSKTPDYRILFFFCLLTFVFFLFIPDILPQSNGINNDLSKLKFKILTTKNGLTQNYVTAIAQDSKGLMWFGSSSGLQKYDGYTFTRYTHNPFDTTTLSGDAVREIFEDSRGLLWINIGGRKCDIMDLKTEKVLREPFTTNGNLGRITEDKEGNIWISGGDASSVRVTGRLFRISRESIEKSDFKLVQFYYHPDNPQILDILPDENGILWLGTTDGLVKLRPESERPPEYYHFKDLEKNVKYLPGAISTITEENDSTLWLGFKSGLILFNKETGGTTIYRHGEQYGVDIRGIVHDRNGMIWTNKYIFMKKGSTYQRFRIKNFPETSSRVFVDRAGNIWIGSGYGLYVYFPESNRFRKFTLSQKTPESHMSVRAFLEDSRKNLWFSTWNYIYKWDRTTNEVTSFKDMLNKKLFVGTGALAIAEDRNEIIWFVSARGLTSYDLRSNRKAYHISDFPDMAVHGVFSDREGEIWFVTGRNLRKLTDAARKQYISYRFNEKPPQYGENWHAALYQDKAGNIWFTSTIGLVKFNHQSKKFTIYSNDPNDLTSISRNWTMCICPDPLEPSEKLWIGINGGGLNLFNKHTETFTHISEEDGLPDNVVYGILSDKQGNLWLSTNRGISKYNPISKHFINYDANDGLQSDEFNTGAYFKSKSGEMFFGGIDGFNYFYPGLVANKEAGMNVVFTDFRLFSKSVSVRDSNSILKKVISETKEITLSNDQNIFSFEFALLDYYAPGKNRFAYKLEGYNEDWIQLGTRRQVTFTGLIPGEYTLKVKGTNSDGIWSNKVASMKIIITPPFWATWWAYSIYILFGLFVLYSLRRYELNRTQLKNQVKLDEVKLKEREETDRMKSRFFANISHEFRTPLTLIKGPAERINRNSSGDEIEKQTGVIKRNADRLLGLINQLLDLSKLEAGKLELKASKENIVSFAKGITMSFESVAEGKDITLKVTSERGQIELYFDKEKMTKIMTNLLSNAFKFTPDGGQIIVSINETKNNTVISKDPPKAETENSSLYGNKISPFGLPAGRQGRNDNEGVVEIKVKDTGQGIPEEELPKLFDRFYQVDSSQTREHEGTGIGLALTKELVELHHGSISADSKPGDPDKVGTGWTEFTIKLPLGRKHLKDEEIVEAEAESTVILNEVKNLGGYDFVDSSLQAPQNDSTMNEDKNIVLVVEDNTDVREYIKDSIGNDFQIEEAQNGEQGVRKAEQIIPDLIISDIMMPKMDGNELTSILKNDEKTSHIPIILLTAKSEQQSRLEGLETGADDYLTKPFNTKELQIRIKNLISIRRKLQEKYSRGDYVPDKRGEEKKLSNLEEQFMKKVMEVIELHLPEEEFSIEQFSSEVGMSRVQLHRKLKALSGKSASNYLRSVRLNRARQMIEGEKGNISEIAYSVGFSSPQYFSKCFKEEFGYPPSDLMN